MAYEYATKTLKFHTSEIFLVGQSIGTGPTCEIAKRLYCKDDSSCWDSFNPSDCFESSTNNSSKHEIKQDRLGGIILISPFKSAAQVVTNSSLGYFIDFFQNENKISRIKAPILIIHGDHDTVIPHSHSEGLFSLCQENDRFCSVANADHNDIWEFKETNQAIKDFLHR